MVEFLKQETQSTQYFPDPFYIVNHRVQQGGNLNSLRITMEIENRPLDKSTLEILSIILRYNYTLLGIDGRSIQQSGSDEPRITFKFTGLLMPTELKLVSSNPAMIAIFNS